MRFRKLRIAFSAVCGIAWLLLIVLWVRSYRVEDYLAVKAGELKVLVATSLWGRIDIGCNQPEILPSFVRWGSKPPAPVERYYAEIRRKHEPNVGFAVREFGLLGWQVTIPHWFLLAMLGIGAVLPFASQFGVRFSLRTLLIGMTLVAVVLGAVIWAVR